MFKHFRKVTIVLIVLLGSIESNLSYAALATSGSVYMYSYPGSWVGGALGSQQVTWGHGTDGLFSSNGTTSNAAQITFNNGNSWSFEFAAPTYDPATNTISGTPLKVGLYANATRWPFNSATTPGLSVSGAGRGDNILSGWFNVLDVAFAPDGNLLVLAVDFRQFDETTTQTGPSLYGSLRFNSSVPINPVPLPAGALLFLSGLLPLAGLQIGKFLKK